MQLVFSVAIRDSRELVHLRPGISSLDGRGQFQFACERSSTVSPQALSRCSCFLHDGVPKASIPSEPLCHHTPYERHVIMCKSYVSLTNAYYYKCTLTKYASQIVRQCCLVLGSAAIIGCCLCSMCLLIIGIIIWSAVSKEGSDQLGEVCNPMYRAMFP